MDYSDLVLGRTTTKTLRERSVSTLLTIGKDRFTRSDLAKVDCWNFHAAANLSALLNQELKVKNTKDVFDNVAPSALAIPRLGLISLAVLGSAFEALGIGGPAPLEAWVRLHLQKDENLTTFHNLKKREAEAHAAERTALAQRKAARKQTAHKLRVTRFTQRAGVAV